MIDNEAVVRRGQRARALLSDDLLAESFATLETEYIEAWKRTSARDADARERLWQAVQIVGKVRSHLSAVVNDGTIADREIQDIQRLGERRKLFGIV